jgi:hypothetical protein
MGLSSCQPIVSVRRSNTCTGPNQSCTNPYRAYLYACLHYHSANGGPYGSTYCARSNGCSNTQVRHEHCERYCSL